MDRIWPTDCQLKHNSVNKEDRDYHENGEVDLLSQFIHASVKNKARGRAFTSQFMLNISADKKSLQMMRETGKLTV